MVKNPKTGKKEVLTAIKLLDETTVKKGKQSYIYYTCNPEKNKEF